MITYQVEKGQLSAPLIRLERSRVLNPKYSSRDALQSNSATCLSSLSAAAMLALPIPTAVSGEEPINRSDM